MSNPTNGYEKLWRLFSSAISFIKRFWARLNPVLQAVITLATVIGIVIGVINVLNAESNNAPAPRAPSERTTKERTTKDNSVPATIALSVKPLEPINPNNTFSTPFEITNNEQFAIYDVKYQCFLTDVVTGEGARYKYSELRSQNSIPALAPNDTATGLCGGGTIPMIGSDKPFRKADIVFKVSFTLSRQLPDRMIKLFSFRGVPEPDGDVRWLSQPI